MEQREVPVEETGQENVESLNDLQRMVLIAANQIETRLSATLDNAIESINAKIETNAAAAVEITAKAKTAMETLPAVIQEHIEGQLRANLKTIVEEVGNQFEEKVKKFTGGSNGAGGMDFLDKALTHSDKIIGIVNAFRSPTTEQAMMGQMNMVFRWHTLLSKLEKGGANPEEITKTISDTFTPAKE